MSSSRKLQENWDGLAKADPLWAICVDPRKRNHRFWVVLALSIAAFQRSQQAARGAR
ncbi:MAG: hypothetical protein JWN45_2551 [Acidobacteriaceae bacterium]|nr:hypothetical protein [Acidobacteriaceae bacterium]